MSWTRIAIAAGVIVAAAAAAWVVDSRIAHADLDPATATRYRTLRRSISTVIVFIGITSALLVIPQVRAAAGAILASSAVLGLIIGLAAQRTLGNFVAGLLIAFTQPIRLGDEVEVEEVRGVVEEIGITYTWVRTAENDRLVVPNEKIVSESLRNSTIRSDLSLAEVALKVPGDADLSGILDTLADDGREVFLADVGEQATIVVRRWVARSVSLERAESDLRLAAWEQLRGLGVMTGDAA